MGIENTVLFDYINKLQKHDLTRKEIKAKRSKLDELDWFNELEYEKTKQKLYEYISFSTFKPLEHPFDD